MKDHKHKILTTAILASVTTASIYVINKAIAKTAVLKDYLHVSSNYDYFQWRFGDIYYSKKGSGSPILLVHDLNPAASAYQWHNLIDDLSKNHTVYAIDLLGCGRSDHPKITYTNYLYVQLIHDFIKNVIQEPSDVIASQFSSSFIITACSTESNLFKKIMLINPESLENLSLIPTKQTKTLKFLLEMPIIGTLLYNMQNNRNSVELLFTEKLYYNPFHVNVKDVDVAYESAHKDNCDGKYLTASIVGRYTNINILHALKSIDNSIFIVGGDQVPDIDSIITRYEEYNSSIEYEIISRAKFIPELECSEKLLEQIDIFF